MQVRVRGYLTFRRLLGDQMVSLPDDRPVSLHDLLQALYLDHGAALREVLADGESSLPRREVAILVNGVHYTHTPARLERLLKDGDEVAIFPPIAGGTQDCESID